MMFTLASGKCTMLDTIDGHSKLIVNRIFVVVVVIVTKSCEM